MLFISVQIIITLFLVGFTDASAFCNDPTGYPPGTDLYMIAAPSQLNRGASAE